MQQQNNPPKIFPKKIGVFGWFWVVCCSVDGVDLISQTEPAGSRPSFWSVSSGSMAGTWLEHEPPENLRGFLLNSKWFTASHIGFCMCNLTWTQFGSEVKIECWFQLIQTPEIQRMSDAKQTNRAFRSLLNVSTAEKFWRHSAAVLLSLRVFQKDSWHKVVDFTFWWNKPTAHSLMSIFAFGRFCNHPNKS